MRLTEEQRDWLTLVMVPGVGTTHFIRLLARFRTPGEVLAAPYAALKEVVGAALADRIGQYADVVDLGRQERLIQEYDVSVVTLEDAAYPIRLAEIYDPPLVLFVRGELREQDERCVAIVGTRRPTPYGIRMAEKFGAELAARGITVVSGMAAGIDAAAHRGALDAGGRTIALLGCGVDVVYPRQNAELMERIIQSGCVMSEFAMGSEPLAQHFPQRNRVISGLTLGALVVEAPAQSGALISARHAAEQGREVFAVPGQIGVRNSAGPHALIREGAKLVESVEDILAELDIPEALPVLEPVAAEGEQGERPASKPPEAPAPEASATPVGVTERNVLSALSPDGSYIDEIAASCRIPVSEALSSLTVLELKGLVRQFSGKRFAPR